MRPETLVERGSRSSPAILAVIVVLHLVVTAIHGSAHTSAGVSLGVLAMGFVLVVIMAGPLIGLAWMWRNPVAGARLIGVTMTAALVFGLVNHFVLPGADRVDHVMAHSRALFGTTAVMLVVTEAIGAALGLGLVRTSAARKVRG